MLPSYFVSLLLYVPNPNFVGRLHFDSCSILKVMLMITSQQLQKLNPYLF